MSKIKINKNINKQRKNEIIISIIMDEQEYNQRKKHLESKLNSINTQIDHLIKAKETIQEELSQVDLLDKI